jgi:hypothetical protein
LGPKIGGQDRGLKEHLAGRSWAIKPDGGLKNWQRIFLRRKKKAEDVFKEVRSCLFCVCVAFLHVKHGQESEKAIGECY